MSCDLSEYRVCLTEQRLGAKLSHEYREEMKEWNSWEERSDEHGD